MYFSRLSSLSHLSRMLPLLFIFAFSIVFLSSNNTYATDGYLTGDITKFDGFIDGNPNTLYYTRWVTYGKYGLNGVRSELPQLCKKPNANPTSCNSNNVYWSNKQGTFVQSLDINDGNYNINGTESVTASQKEQVPTIWYGKKIMLTWYLGFSIENGIDESGNFIFEHQPTFVQLNWGAFDYANPLSTAQACSDYVQTRVAIINGVTTNDFIHVELDYTNATPDMNCYIQPRLKYSGDKTRGYLWYNDSDYNIYTVGKYIGWDILDESTDDLPGLIDDWKQQQDQEFEQEVNTINDNGNNAQSSADSLSLSFSVLNVFTGWFGLFTANDCVNIPTVASMIHVSNNQVCSPWPSNVRSTLSPVFAIFGTVVLSFFIYRWLMKREGQEVE